ncbi:alanine racemase [Actinokineospora auranticolor]|uniref:Alanine racemase n=1 Tax=Actinokineospora auranticolor TaxID=155976 RepID=A0A2S6GWR0_9PSEU|nr:alanine racemase [Actinokineospora auranticolor]PPK69591.1 alanine racemase [Actinokineospora auranticolor]
MSRAEVVVDLDALRHNVSLLVARAPGADAMAVVKADGYGHGAVRVARAALSAGVTWLGSCSLNEALVLRDAGITAPILSWLDTPDADMDAAVEAGIDVGVSSVEELDRLSGARVHLKVDTGLARNGCPPGRWADLVRAAAESDNEVYAVWSHLACADVPGHPSVDAQAQRFEHAYKTALDAGLTPRRHLANSAATLSRPDLHFDMVRLGIAMYGLNPLPTKEDLIPVMTFRASVAMVKRVAAGESVSYGQTWTAPRDTTLALVTAGYADGVPRLLSNRVDVLLGGVRRPVRGRVCMDQIVVDCGDDEVSPGDEVVLFGPGTRGEPTATEWADTIGTIDYEIVTGMYRPRVARRYVGG